MSETYVVAPDGTPERLIQRLENTTPGELFYCEADREEAVEIAQEEFAAALSAAEARGRAAGQWQTMDSAPKGRDAGGRMQMVLLIGRYPGPSPVWTDIRQGWWDGFGERWDRWPHSFPPSHWMPSPEPPALDVVDRTEGGR